MKDDLNFKEMEEDLNFKENVEEDLNFSFS